MITEQGLEGMYYIICTNEEANWWQLRKTDDHQVVACGVGKDFVLKALKRQVDKYPNKRLLQEDWSSLEYIKPLRKEEQEQRRLQYEVVKDISDVEISNIITKSKPKLRPKRRDIKDQVPLGDNQVEETPIQKTSGTSIRRRRLVRK